jgi:hypothetical protein
VLEKKKKIEAVLNKPMSMDIVKLKDSKNQ